MHFEIYLVSDQQLSDFISLFYGRQKLGEQITINTYVAESWDQNRV